jgi:hypothetical protein
VLPDPPLDVEDAASFIPVSASVGSVARFGLLLQLAATKPPRATSGNAVQRRVAFIVRDDRVRRSC